MFFSSILLIWSIVLIDLTMLSISSIVPTDLTMLSPSCIGVKSCFIMVSDPFDVLLSFVLVCFFARIFLHIFICVY